MRALPLLLLLTSPIAAAQDATPPPPAAVATPAAPCSRPEYRQFDFWIGDWDVTAPGGKVVGHSHIESILGGCVIAEHWDSEGNTQGDGKSYNQFNAGLGKWEQFWVDASGMRLVLAGSFANGAMVLEGRQEPDPKTGIAGRERITWTANADGSVRQLWESSKDDGATWSVAFDGLYRRRAKD
jgi:hypothetical protein